MAVMGTGTHGAAALRPPLRGAVVWAAALIMAVTFAVGPIQAAEPNGKGAQHMSLTITSSAIAPGESIPPQFTCDGADRSPPLGWSGVPAGAKSLALIVDDPDAPDPAAPKMTWVHWVLYDLPPDSDGLPEAVSAQALPPGTRQGSNNWKRTGYGGPCPPIGTHRYFFKLYALDVQLGDLDSPSKARLEQAMRGHVVAEAQLMGTYHRHR